MKINYCASSLIEAEVAMSWLTEYHGGADITVTIDAATVAASAIASDASVEQVEVMIACIGRDLEREKQERPSDRRLAYLEEEWPIGPAKIFVNPVTGASRTRIRIS